MTIQATAPSCLIPKRPLGIQLAPPARTVAYAAELDATTSRDHRGPSRKKPRVLILNANWEPRAVVTVERAFCLLFEQGRARKVEVVLQATDVLTGEIAPENQVWMTTNAAHPVPLILRLAEEQSPLFDLPSARVGTPSLRALIRRDGRRCQYCLIHENDLDEGNFFTIDHVIPQSRFPSYKEATYWENIVTACFRCNNFKANRTPQEAGMKLHALTIEEPKQWDIVQHDLMHCQKAYLHWLHGGPLPRGILVSAEATSALETNQAA